MKKNRDTLEAEEVGQHYIHNNTSNKEKKNSTFQLIHLV